MDSSNAGAGSSHSISEVPPYLISEQEGDFDAAMYYKSLADFVAQCYPAQMELLQRRVGSLSVGELRTLHSVLDAFLYRESSLSRH